MSDKTVDMSDLSRYRGQLMGAAMLMVILFHIGGMRHDTIFYCISRCGNVGVDVFLFLSGIGLWFAWSRLVEREGLSQDVRRTPSWRALAAFYRRRYIRVYPAWLVIACAYYIPLYAEGRAGLADTALSIAVNWGFWEHDELTFWFIPAIMALYTVAPAYMELIRRKPVWRWMPAAAMMLCVLVQYWAPLHRTVGHLEIFFSRIPIFLIGVNAGLWVKQGRCLEPSARGVLWLMFVMSAVACVNFEDGLRGRFPLFLERMVYIPLTVSMTLLLCRLLRRLPKRVNGGLAFVGGVSLELYLIHIEFVFRHVQPYRLGYWLTAVTVTGVSLAAAWLLHKIISAAVGRWA